MFIVCLSGHIESLIRPLLAAPGLLCVPAPVSGTGCAGRWHWRAWAGRRGAGWTAEWAVGGGLGGGRGDRSGQPSHVSLPYLPFLIFSYLPWPRLSLLQASPPSYPPRPPSAPVARLGMSLFAPLPPRAALPPREMGGDRQGCAWENLCQGLLGWWGWP